MSKQIFRAGLTWSFACMAVLGVPEVWPGLAHLTVHSTPSQEPV